MGKNTKSKQGVLFKALKTQTFMTILFNCIALGSGIGLLLLGVIEVILSISHGMGIQVAISTYWPFFASGAVLGAFGKRETTKGSMDDPIVKRVFEE